MQAASSVRCEMSLTFSEWKTGRLVCPTCSTTCSAVTQCALKWSKGSLQSSQTHSDLHAVDPKRLSSWVDPDPHCGHRSESRNGTGPEVRCSGGAMPYSRSFS